MAHDHGLSGGLAFELSQRLLQLLRERPALPLEARLVSQDLFRICSHGSPLSIKGCFAFGQRVNIGAAQALKSFDQIYGTQVFGGIYAALDEVTALKEFYGEDLAPDAEKSEQIYRLVPRSQPLHLVDLDSFISSLESSWGLRGLDGAFRAEPVSGDWEYCKFPQPSQILGWWVYQHRATFEGISFASTRHSPGTNVFLFFDSDDDAAQRLKIEAAEPVAPRLQAALTQP